MDGCSVSFPVPSALCLKSHRLSLLFNHTERYPSEGPGETFPHPNSVDDTGNVKLPLNAEHCKFILGVLCFKHGFQAQGSRLAAKMFGPLSDYTLGAVLSRV